MSQGEKLKNHFRSKSKKMGHIADELGMSPQNLYHHLRKSILQSDFLRLVQSTFPEDDIAAIVGINKTSEKTAEPSIEAINKAFERTNKTLKMLVDTQQQTITSQKEIIEQLTSEIKRLKSKSK